MIEMRNMRESYIDLLHIIHDRGSKVSPRGQETYELRGETLRFKNIRDMLATGIGRKLNMSIAAIETVQIIGTYVDPQMMVKISPTFKKFMEDDGRFWGGYGERVAAQFVLAAQKLAHDPDTRQAIVTLWNPTLDNAPGKRDYPCTLSMCFQIRQGILDMQVTMRSNDAWLGLPYDVFVFTQVQMTMARALNVPAGEYLHHTYSLHLYKRDIEKKEDLHPFREGLHTDWLEGFGYDRSSYTTGTSMFDAQRRAYRIGHGMDIHHPTPSEQWFIDRLEAYRD